MKRRLLLTMAGALLVSSMLAAQSGGFDRFGYRVTGQRVEGGVPTFDVVDADGFALAVSLRGALNERQAEALNLVRSTFRDLPGLRINRLRVLFDGNRADILVVPRSLTVGAVDLAPYIPAGMQFSFLDTLEYDFRMLVNNLALRMSGRYFTADQFLDRLLRAFEAPAAYIQSQDPEFLFRRLDEQQRLLEERAADDRRQDQTDREIRAEMSAAAAALRADGESAVATLYREGEAEAARLEAVIAELRADHEQLRQAHLELLDAHRTLAAAHGELSGENEQLRAEFDTFRQGAVVLFTRGLFGGLKPIGPEVVARIVALRGADPTLTPDAARTAVAAEFPDAGLHKKHVQAVYGYFFNQYE